MRIEDDKIKDDRNDNETTAWGLIWSIVQLAGLHIIQCIRGVLKFVIRCIAKVLLWLMENIELFVEFLQSKDAQQKKEALIKWFCTTGQEIKDWTVVAAKFLWKWTKICSAKAWVWTKWLCRNIGKWSVIAFHATVAGCIWFAHAVVEFIIHMKPTVIRIGKAIKEGSIAFWLWLKRVHKGQQIRAVNRRRAMIHFQHNGGFKGLLDRTRHNMRTSITTYMDEEQTEASQDAVTEADIFEEEMEENDGRVHIFGRKFYNKIKDIVEEK